MTTNVGRLIKAILAYVVQVQQQLVTPQVRVAAMATLDLNALSVFGHPLSQDATYQQRLAYRENVLKLPGPVDRWLTANSRSPRVKVLQDYLMLRTSEFETEHVTCVVEREYTEVSAPLHNHYLG
jgi:hypothetical protein